MQSCYLSIIRECSPAKISRKKKYHLSDLIDEYFPTYVLSKSRTLRLEDHHFKAMNQMRLCQTSHMGIVCFECEGCGKHHFFHQSCKNRFCSKCGISSTYKWGEETLSRLLKMKHHHVVTTLPSPLRHLSKMNGNLLYNILFKASSEVLKVWFKDQHNLLPGIVSVLHTAGSDLKYHPHIHMVLSGGGKDLTSGDYRELKGNYLCSQKLLGLRLKYKFKELLLKSYRKGELQVSSGIKDETGLKAWFEGVGGKHWIVSIQKPLSDLSQVVGYVGRYTKRCCLSEYKIEEVKGGRIKFRFTDYKNSERGKKPVESVLELSMEDFFDRLLQHVPTPRYRMVRYSGLYNSYHLKQVPKELRGEGQKVLSKEEVEELDREWGEYEDYRKKQILLGRADPLYCKDCERSLVFVELIYKKKAKLKYYDDS